MHHSSLRRMKWFVDNYAGKLPDSGTRLRVLDVGSCSINGSYKHFFDTDRYEYTGLDMTEGPNVDVVVQNAYRWSEIETDSFDIVISGQTFEHAEFFWVTMSEMARALKENGLLCLIAPNGFHEHRFPVDCYRFFSDGMVALARYVSLKPLHAHTNCASGIKDYDWYSEKNADSMLIAVKPYAGQTKIIDLCQYHCRPENLIELRKGMSPYQNKLQLFIGFALKVFRKITKN